MKKLLMAREIFISNMGKKEIIQIVDKFKGGDYCKNDFLSLLKVKDPEHFSPVIKHADRVCEEIYKKDVFLRGIIEFSNYCVKNCLYCGIRAGNKNINRYRISLQEIAEIAEKAQILGIKTVVLQSGEDPYYNDSRMVQIIKEIKLRSEVAVTLSLGERTFESYKALKEAGADRYLLRIETTDPKLYKSLHPDSSLLKRKKCLQSLKELGYETGTGIMVGLPGQSLQSIVEDIFYFKEIDADMVGIGPFLPHCSTPLRNAEKEDFFLTLKTLSLIRILNPDINIPATTAMGTIDPRGREKALKAGANVLMPNLTPSKYRGDYILYDNKICLTEEPGKCAGCVESIAESARKSVKEGKGFRRISM